MADEHPKYTAPSPPAFPDWSSPGGSEIPASWLQQVYGYLIQHPLPVPISQLSGYQGIITGRASTDGTINGGTGFTVTHLATGKCRVTYDVPFSSEPTVVLTLISPDASPSGHPLVFSITTSNETRFEMAADVPGGSTFDLGFNFLVMAAR